MTFACYIVRLNSYNARPVISFVPYFARFSCGDLKSFPPTNLFSIVECGLLIDIDSQIAWFIKKVLFVDNFSHHAKCFLQNRTNSLLERCQLFALSCAYSSFDGPERL